MENKNLIIGGWILFAIGIFGSFLWPVLFGAAIIGMIFWLAAARSEKKKPKEEQISGKGIFDLKMIYKIMFVVAVALFLTWIIKAWTEVNPVEAYNSAGGDFIQNIAYAFGMMAATNITYSLYMFMFIFLDLIFAGYIRKLSIENELAKNEPETRRKKPVPDQTKMTRSIYGGALKKNQNKK
ncbi:hypothetical protein [Methanolapillus millepedarum]|uniref:Uncharacterized protein n=1 Tax=Methanolapillus millepedarum TaxID=3028296 RepID=A0AA96V1E7_9EURY|nr:hypothetical protein MsAc7_00580 [Methanosarcinaceae archaeon Ac7]